MNQINFLKPKQFRLQVLANGKLIQRFDCNKELDILFMIFRSNFKL